MNGYDKYCTLRWIIHPVGLEKLAGVKIVPLDGVSGKVAATTFDSLVAHSSRFNSSSRVWLWHGNAAVAIWRSLQE